MDLSTLAGALLGADSVKGLSKASGASKSDVTSVLSAALPALLSGAREQAKDADSGFEGALKDHAKKDTSDLGSFLGGVDLGDGAKIIGHLLGGSTSKETEKIADKAGVSADKTGTILAAAAPLLMSLLGKQSAKDEEESGSPVASLIGAVLSNVDVGDLVGSLLGGSSDEDEEKGKKKKKAAEEEEAGLGDLVGGLLGSLLK